MQLPAPFSQFDLANQNLLVLGAYALLAGLLLAWSGWHAIPTTEPPGDRHSSP